MGESKQQEEVNPETKPEEKQEEKKEEKKEEKEEETQEEEKPHSPPAPIVLYVDLHCVGCAKKIEKSILNCRGVESVETDMAQNQVTVKGMVEPQVLCSRIRQKTLREAEVLSPAPEADAAQVSVITTAELHVNMHCEACSQQLRKKILKMKGVRTVETELSSGKVTVTGTINADKLVEYVYRRTRKQARIVPQPPKEEEEGGKKAKEKPSDKENKEEKKEEEKKEEEKKEPEQEGDGDGGSKEEKPAGGGGGGEEQKKEEEGEPIPASSAEDMAKRMMYWAPAVYVVERLPPPQLFSDENPNACCIS